MKEFKYLGSTVQKTGGADKVAKRVQGRVSAKMKGRLYKMIVRPAMLYGMEAVAVTKRQEDRMEVAEMKILRYSLGKTKMDRIKNEDMAESIS